MHRESDTLDRSRSDKMKVVLEGRGDSCRKETIQEYIGLLCQIQRGGVGSAWQFTMKDMLRLRFVRLDQSLHVLGLLLQYVLYQYYH